VVGAWGQIVMSRARPGRPGMRMLLVAAVQAAVPRTASLEPPTCWPVLRMLEAAPEPVSATWTWQPQ